MSREIDLTKKLSDEDRQYLVERDRWRDLALADGHEDIERAKREATEANDISQGRRPPTLVGEPARVAEANASQAPVEAEEDLPYEEWSYDELKAELDARKTDAIAGGMNTEDANKRYSKGGSQKDLVQRLHDDDEAAQQ